MPRFRSIHQRGRSRYDPTVALLAALALLLAGCGAVGNHARINALQDEFRSTEFPYDVVLDEESVSIAGPNLEMTDTNERNRIVGTALLGRGMLEVADETLAWMPTAGWESPVTQCNENEDGVSAVFMWGSKSLGSWEAQIRIGINHDSDGRAAVAILMDAPPVGETTLPPRDGDVAPCWRN